MVRDKTMSISHRSIWQKLFAMIIIPLLVFGFLEFVLEFLCWVNVLPTEYYFPQVSVGSGIVCSDGKPLLVMDSDLMWRTRVNFHGECSYQDPSIFVPTTTNSHGYRMAEFDPQKQPGTFRVLIMGDSSSFGFGVYQEDMYANRLSNWASRSFPNKSIEIINASTIGYTMAQVAMLLDMEGWSYDPDLLIISAGFNDSHKHYQLPVSEYMSANGIIPWIKHLLNKTMLYRYLHSLFNRGVPNEHSDEKINSPMVPLDEYEYLLNMIIEKARRNNVRVILLPISVPPKYYGVMKKVSQHQNVPLVLTEEALKARYIELTSHGKNGDAEVISKEIYQRYIELEAQDEQMMSYRKDNLLFLDPCHPNSDGHRVIAEAVEKVITNNHLIQ